MKKWSEPTGKGPVAMKSYETLIPTVISKHYEAVTAYGLGFEGHTCGARTNRVGGGFTRLHAGPTITGSG